MSKKLDDVEYEFLICKYLRKGCSFRYVKDKLKNINEKVIISYFTKPKDVVI